MTASVRLAMAGMAAALVCAGIGACFSEHVAAQSTSIDATATCANPAAAGPNVVIIRNFLFAPQTVRVRAGDHVTWVNCETASGLAHTSTSDGGVWQSTLLAPGASFDRSFGQTGTFAYHCSIHPQMTATVVVQ